MAGRLEGDECVREHGVRVAEQGEPSGANESCAANGAAPFAGDLGSPEMVQPRLLGNCVCGKHGLHEGMAPYPPYGPAIICLWCQRTT